MQQTDDVLCSFLDGGVESSDPLLDLWVVPAFGDIVLQRGVWWLQDVGEGWWFRWWWSGCVRRGGWCGRSAGVLDWCEWVAQVLEFLTCTSQFVVGVLEGA